MTISRWILFITGITYVIFAVAFILFPVMMATKFDTALETPTALSNFRSAQGGLQLGLGAYLICCGIRKSWVRSGLAAQALTSGGFVIGRVVSLFVDGEPKPVTYGLLLVEIVGCAVALVLLQVSRQKTKG